LTFIISHDIGHRCSLWQSSEDQKSNVGGGRSLRYLYTIQL